jgi:hypothetical protein
MDEELRGIAGERGSSGTLGRGAVGHPVGTEDEDPPPP